MDALAVAGLIAGSFAATNIDNLALLVSWLLAGKGPPRQILLGYLLGMIALFVVACGFGFGAKIFPDRYVGYLGVVPIGLGLKGLYDLFRARDSSGSKSEPAAVHALVLSIATTQLANGIDTVLVFGPLLADSELGVDFAVVIGFFVMVMIWFWFARFLETHAGRLEVIERYGHWISPIVLIVIGFYILDNTGTDVLAGE